MVDNPTKIYNDYVRANLPNSMSYDTGTDRYDINSHSFFKFKNSNWYFNYISKYGYSALTAYAVNGFEPALVFDFKGNYFRKSATDSTFPASITHAATTNATMADGYGPEVVTNGKFGTDTAGWVSGSSAATSAAVSGEMQVTNVSSNGRVITAIPTVVGKLYEVSGVGRVISGNGGPAASLYLTNSIGSTIQGGTINYTTTDAPLGLFFTATATTSYISAITFGNVGNVSAFDNVSVRQSPALKWRPHNLLTHSGDLTNAGWNTTGLTITTGQNDFEGNPTAFKLTPTAVSGLHRFYKTLGNSRLSNGTTSTVTIDLKADGYNFFSIASANTRWTVINLSDGTVSLDSNSVSPTVTSLGNGWYRCSITTPIVTQEVFSVGETSQGNSFGSQTFTGDGTSGVLVAYPHSFRSDLGGMVNNPDTASSYVPTTTTPVYLSRRGQHAYNGSAWVNEGILHESEARTNLLNYSNNFTNGAWSKTNVTVTNAQTTGPDGRVSAAEIGITGTGGNSYAIHSAASTTGTLSYFAKQNTERFFIIVRGPYGAGDWAIFDLSNGTVSKSPIHTNSTAHMVPMGNGWYRCVLQSAQVSSVNAFTISGSGTDNSTSTSGTVYLYGAQMETGTTPSSYIPTVSSTVTRAAETLTVPAANLPYPTPVEVTGTELVTNGDFSDGLTGWTQNANATGTSNVIGGQLVQTAPHGDYSETKQLNGSTVGKTYLCSFKVTAKVDSSTSVFISFGRTPVYSGSIANIPIGVFSGAVTSVHPDGFSISTRTNGQITIDNVSVKEVSYKLSIQMDGKMTYADTGASSEVQPYRWRLDSTNYISASLSTLTGRTGQIAFEQRQSPTSGYDFVAGTITSYSPDTNVPFNLAGRHGSTFINGAHEGTLLTANTTPTALPDLSSSDLSLGYIFMGTIGEFRMWSDDLGDVGITEATLPSTEPSLSLTFDGSENSFIVLDWSE